MIIIFIFQKTGDEVGWLNNSFHCRPGKDFHLYNKHKKSERHTKVYFHMGTAHPNFDFSYET